MNKVIITGRLTADPEMRQTQNNVSVTTFTLAVNRDHNKEETDFVSCVAWRQTAEFISKYFQKGQLMLANGSLQSRKWTDKDNNKRINWDVVVDNVYFCESKKNDGYSGGEPQYTPPKAPDVVADDDGELPF